MVRELRAIVDVKERVKTLRNGTEHDGEAGRDWVFTRNTSGSNVTAENM